MKILDILGEARQDVMRGNINAPKYAQFIGKAPTNPLTSKQTEFKNKQLTNPVQGQRAAATVQQAKQIQAQQPAAPGEIRLDNIMTRLPQLMKQYADEPDWIKAVFNTLTHATKEHNDLWTSAVQHDNERNEMRKSGIRSSRGKRVPPEQYVVAKYAKLTPQQKQRAKQAIMSTNESLTEGIKPSAEQLQQIATAYKSLSAEQRNVLWRKLQDIAAGGDSWRYQPSMAGVNTKKPYIRRMNAAKSNLKKALTKDGVKKGFKHVWDTLWTPTGQFINQGTQKDSFKQRWSK